MSVCGRCQGTGHNARTCGRGAPRADGIDAVMIEPPPAHGPDLSWKPFAERFALKRNSGECVQCVRKSVRANRCEWHYWRFRRSARASLKRRRLHSKLHGICVYCHQRKAAADSSYCEICEPLARAVTNYWGRTKAGRKSRRDSQRRRRIAATEYGLCQRCGEAAVTDTLCESCRDKHNAASQARRGHGSRVVRCSKCGERYHNARSCKQRDENDRINATEYATARPGITVEPNWEVYR